MSAVKRPMVNVPEGPGETNVYREMNDEEFEQHKRDAAAFAKAAKAAAEAPHPLVAQIAAMSDEQRAELAALLNK